MARHLYTAAIDWRLDGDFAANAYSRGHVWRFDGGVEVPASSSPLVVPHHSVAAAVDPEEAFVAALSSCHMLWFLDFARRDGLAILAYRDRAEGEMTRIEPGRWAIAAVTLRPEIVIAGRELPPPERLAALHEKAHAACFIANSVRSEIVVDPLPARLAASADTEETG